MCRHSIGVEWVAEAVELAKANAESNSIPNASFICGRAENVLPSLLKGRSKVGAVAVLDPPRAGLGRTALHALRMSNGIRRLAYISCNPNSFTEDAVQLCCPKEEGAPFAPVRCCLVDMFPQTAHCEMLCIFERLSEVPVCDKRRNIGCDSTESGKVGVK